MSLSSMPTGTVSRDGSGSRTYPLDGSDTTETGAETDETYRQEPSPSTASPSTASPSTASPSTASPNPRTASPSTPSPSADVSSLRRENEALRETNAQLRSQLEAAYEDKQDVIDRYERIVGELQSRSSSSNASLKQSSKQSPKKSSRKRGWAAARSVSNRVMARVLSALGLY
ncbi:hypothetical protein ACH9L7_13435 [Haloferax sp. S1W]|uniref:hypothetical protein n=1 Tax=Haloferax sp. S1W TaxID=3377110 RepID=UPI0037CC67E9